MKCPLCDGTGKRMEPSFRHPGEFVSRSCVHCYGKGEIETPKEREEKIRVEERQRVIAEIVAWLRAWPRKREATYYAGKPRIEVYDDEAAYIADAIERGEPWAGEK